MTRVCGCNSMICKILKQPFPFCLSNNRYRNLINRSFIYFLSIGLIKACICTCFIRYINILMIFWWFVFHNIISPKKLSYLIVNLNISSFFMTDRSICNGFVFQLYSFSYIKSFRFSDSSNPLLPQIPNAIEFLYPPF